MNAGGRALALGPVGAGLALCACVGAAGVLDRLPEGPAAILARTCAGVALLLWPLALIARLAPSEPAVLKSLTLSLLLAPVGAAAFYTLAHLGVDSRTAVLLTLLAVAAVQWSARGQRLALISLGPGAKAAACLAVFCALLCAFLLLRGNASRVSYHGLLHSALVQAVERRAPPQNPFFAGAELSYYWFYHAMGACIAGACKLAPTLALAAINVWAATTMPLALYFWCAPLLGRARRELGATLLAIFGLNALGGILWLLHGMPWQAPTEPMELLGVLRGGVGAWDARLAFGFSKFANLSSYPASLTLLIGANLCAAHALRHGKRPWVGMCACLHGATLLVNPITGGIGAAATVLAALGCSSSRARLRLPLLIALWCLPGLWLTLQASAGYGGSVAQFVLPSGAKLWGVVAPLLPLIVAASFLLLKFGPAARAERRAAQAAVQATSSGGSEPARNLKPAWAQLCSAALLPLLLAPMIELPYSNEYKLIRLGAVPLSILAVGGLALALERGGPLRWVGRLTMVVLGVGSIATAGLGVRSYAAFARMELPLVEQGGLLLPLAEPASTQNPARDLARAYAWLQRATSQASLGPVLIANTPGGQTEAFGSASSPHRFTLPGVGRNLQGHEAPVFTGLDLYADRPSQVLSDKTPMLRERLIDLAGLYGDPSPWPAPAVQRLKQLQRDVLVLITAADRKYRGDVEGNLTALGFQAVFGLNEVAILAYPAEFAKSLRARAAAQSASPGDGQ